MSYKMYKFDSSVVWLSGGSQYFQPDICTQKYPSTHVYICHMYWYLAFSCWELKEGFVQFYLKVSSYFSTGAKISFDTQIIQIGIL